MLKLYIGNKNYSSWSMRPWVLLKQAGIPFEEVLLRFDSFDDGSAFKQAVAQLSPVGKVPVLELDDGFTVWDTLAICETLAERFPEYHLWPSDPQARARARSVGAEMHAGFGSLRNHCAMNIEAALPQVGARLWRDEPGVRADVARLVSMWGGLLAAYPRPGAVGADPHFLFGDFGIADAFFAPVCMRLRTYALPVPSEIAAYVERVAAAPGVKAWIDAALAEHDFLSFEEPYRKSADDQPM